MLWRKKDRSKKRIKERKIAKEKAGMVELGVAVTSFTVR